MKQKICAAVAMASFIFILGTAGALDCDSITFNQAAIRTVSAIMIFTGSVYIGGFTK